jgi:peptidoglycan lytic transglycosylase
MKNLIIQFISIAGLLLFLNSCSSTKEVSKHDFAKGTLIESGEASWYGPNFDGRQTANGEIFNQYELTAAHRTLPFNSMVKVINKTNGQSVVVRINDRGPYAKNRIIDLSRRAAEKIKIINSGHAKVDLILLNASKLPVDIKVPYYTVQVGSYKTERDAERVSSTIRNSRIVKAIVNGVQYYRIYVGLFKRINEAKDKKRSLQNKGINGFVKQVEN